MGKAAQTGSGKHPKSPFQQKACGRKLRVSVFWQAQLVHFYLILGFVSSHCTKSTIHAYFYCKQNGSGIFHLQRVGCFDCSVLRYTFAREDGKARLRVGKKNPLDSCPRLPGTMPSDLILSKCIIPVWRRIEECADDKQNKVLKSLGKGAVLAASEHKRRFGRQEPCKAVSRCANNQCLNALKDTCRAGFNY